MALMTQVGVEFIARNRAMGVMSQFERSLRSVGGTLLGMAGVGGGIYALQRGFSNMIRSASDAQETLSKFNVVFREQSGLAARWAEDFGDKVGRSTQDVQKWMAGLQDLFVPLGFARDKAFDLSKTLAELAVDVASFNNQADADVIRDFTSALVGNHEAVRKYGIIITEASLKQEAFAKGITKNYTELTNLEKVSLRYGIIQRASADAQGDALRTADAYANQVKRLSANWTELKTNMGETIVPSLEKLLGVLNKVFDQVEKIRTAWDNMRWSLAQGMMNTGQFSNVAAAQWELARRQYDREMGKWKQVGERGQNRVPADMERFEQLLEHYQSGALTNLPEGKIEFGPGRLKFFEDMARRSRELATAAPAVPIVEMGEEEKRLIIEGARQTMEAVRHQDYLTRMERIESLEAYRNAHADVMVDAVGKETEAGRLIREEIESLLRSRLDAMMLYRKELQEDFESLNLYLSERFADASRSMESAFSSSLQSMMRDGATWRDTMIQFLTEVRNAFIKMAADMVARQAAAKIIEPGMSWLAKIGTTLVTGGMGGGPAANPAGMAPSPEGGWMPVTYHQGGIVGESGHAARYVSPKLFENAPKYHDLETNEVAIIAQRGEEISRPGRSKGGAAPTVIVNNYTGQNFQSEGPSFDGERWVVGIVAQNIKQGGGLKKMIRR
jgi:hypothetical protein